jgi:hypothetical protein
MRCPAGVEKTIYQFSGYANPLWNTKWEDNVAVGVIDGKACSVVRYGL